MYCIIGKLQSSVIAVVPVLVSVVKYINQYVARMAKHMATYVWQNASKLKNNHFMS